MIGSSARRNISPSWLLALLAATSVGCSISAEDLPAQDAEGTTVAFVKIRQVQTLEGATRGDAIAGFLRVPQGGDADQLLALSGLSESLPQVGECADFSAPDPDALGPTSQPASAELLEAQSVELLTGEGVHSLVPHAFPTIADLLRGVVYTSRDREASTLPPQQLYEVSGRNVSLAQGEFAQLQISEVSPGLPQAVRVNGAALEAVTVVPVSAVLDIAWEAGAPQDLVTVAIDAGELSTVCSFSDSEGFGSVPLATPGNQPLPVGTSALISVHRVRHIEEAGQDLAMVGLVFDFALEGTLALVGSSPDVLPEPAQFEQLDAR